MLAVTGSPARRLEGGYWTDRDSKGRLKLMKRSKTLAEDFEEACDALKDRASYALHVAVRFSFVVVSVLQARGFEAILRGVA